MSGVCFVDTETTGLDPDRHPIWNIGLIEPDGRETEWFLPVDLATADTYALNIGHYFERHPSYPPYSAERGLTPVDIFAGQFMQRTWGHHLAGAVISFDEERLRRLLRANGACPGWHYHLIDVEALAAGWLAGVRNDAAAASPDAVADHEANLAVASPPWNSTDLSLAVGVDPADFERHTALGDARWANAIYEAVMGK